MIELVAAVLFLCLLLFIAYPLFRPPEASVAAIRSRSRLDELLNEKEEAYLSVTDVELDYRMGKLSRQDYELLKEESESRAIEVLTKIEAVQTSLDSARQTAKKK